MSEIRPGLSTLSPKKKLNRNLLLTQWRSFILSPYFLHFLFPLFTPSLPFFLPFLLSLFSNIAYLFSVYI